MSEDFMIQIEDYLLTSFFSNRHQQVQSEMAAGAQTSFANSPLEIGDTERLQSDHLPSIKSDDLLVRKVSRQDIGPSFISRWRELKLRSCHANPFLSPDFLIPAWEWLEPEGTSFLLTVEERTSGRMMALGCFQHSLPSWSLPFSHLVAAKTAHTYRTGLLLDDESAVPVLRKLIQYVRTQPHWSGMVFPNLRLDSILAQRLQQAVRDLGLPWHTVGEIRSAAVFPPILTTETINEHLSNRSRKSLRRKLRSLESLGEVRLYRIENESELAEGIEVFLDMEHSGWKGRERTSLRSTESSTQFLNTIAKSFHKCGELVLTQLRAGDQVVATAISLLGATTLYAFKIGWNQRFARNSPGSLHEHLLPSYLQGEFPELTCLDSCSRPGSFLEGLWPHRIAIGEAVIPTSPLARSAVTSMLVARQFKSLFWNQKAASPGDSEE